MRVGWIIAAVIGASVLAFASITLVALESREVVVLRTRSSQGEMHETRVWIADHDGAAMIEAANPQRPFYRDLRDNPEVEVRRHGSLLRMHATVLPQPDGHRLIRRLLRQHYGWADWWIGCIADTSQSLAIKLEPLPPS